MSRFVFGVQILAADGTNQPPMVRLLSLRDGQALVDPTQLVWVPLCTNVVTDGALRFVDTEAPEQRHRFYRIVPQSNYDPEE